jgi:2-hydroxychromene-2-carboxylate isomerase
MDANVISLADARRRRDRRTATGADRRARERRPVLCVFYFDLGDPFTYLAAERVELALPGAVWLPASAAALARDQGWADRAVREQARERAEALGVPLSWPEGGDDAALAANRAAAFASAAGRGAAFAVAAARLAFCGGFDLAHPEVLAEAAAAAGVDLDGCLKAAGDPGRDGEIEAAGRRLLAAGAERLPVLCLGPRLFAGEDQLSAGLACARSAPALTGA